MDIDILLRLQAFRNGAGSVLADFLSEMTYLGESGTVLVIMAIIYWGISKRFGTFLLMGWSANRLVNGFLKITVCAYRPWIRDARILPFGDAIVTATGYSFPSGHTTNAASVYGGGMLWKPFPKGLRLMLGLMVVLVGFSRPYLGVHTPQDVLCGMFIGLTVMWLILKLTQWIEKHPERDWMVAAGGLVPVIAVAVYAACKSYPADYDTAGNLLVDGRKMANDTFKCVGWSSAFLIGWLLERRFVGFSTDVPAERKAARVAAGVISYYAVSMILMPLVSGWMPGAAGTIAARFFQIFYIVFLFPFLFKIWEEKTLARTRPASSAGVASEIGYFLKKCLLFLLFVALVAFVGGVGYFCGYKSAYAPHGERLMSSAEISRDVKRRFGIALPDDAKHLNCFDTSRDTDGRWYLSFELDEDDVGDFIEDIPEKYEVKPSKTWGVAPPESQDKYDLSWWQPPAEGARYYAGKGKIHIAYDARKHILYLCCFPE